MSASRSASGRSTRALASRLACSCRPAACEGDCPGSAIQQPIRAEDSPRAASVSETALAGRPNRVMNPNNPTRDGTLIAGFGGDHTAAKGAANRKAWDLGGTEAIWVVLDASCRLGHHDFADSANNGPCGKAFIEELMPVIEKRYRIIGSQGGLV